MRNKNGLRVGNILSGNGRTAGILGCWSASAMDAMSGSYDWNWCYFADVKKPIKSKKWTILPLPEEPFEIKKKGTRTLPESTQTLCDLIRWDCEPEFVAGAIDWFMYSEGNLDRITQELSKRGLLEKYKEEYEPYLDDARNV